MENIHIKMSNNNQTLIIKHKGKYYIFDNVTAESWCDKDGKHVNELSLKSAIAIYDSESEAFKKAWEVDRDDDFGGTEYGVVLNKLWKDNKKIKIID